MKKNHPDIETVSISVRPGMWEDFDFSGFDAVLHVAALLRFDRSKELADRVFDTNVKLPGEIAKKAKSAGVKQFIFMSSIAVYGFDGKVSKPLIIDGNTPEYPKSLYGKSKLDAEHLLSRLESEDFKISYIRAPMVYGKDCPGTYPSLRSLAFKLPFFPAVNNVRSMLYIANLVELIRLILTSGSSGVFYPQNASPVSTSELFALIRKYAGKTTKLLKPLNVFVSLFGPMGIVQKSFGNLAYDKKLSDHFNGSYQVVGFEESIRLTEENDTKQ